MLLQFTIRNVRSFRNQVTLDLVATNNFDHQYSLIRQVGVEILPVATIYGANAAGKTGLLQALQEMVLFVMQSIDLKVSNGGSEKNSLPVVPFLFDDIALEEPSQYEVVFIVGETEYRYGYIATRRGILKEYLDFKNPKHSSYLSFFCREFQNGIAKIKVGRSQSIKSTEMKSIRVWNAMLSDADLLLTALGRRDKKTENPGRFADIYNWFSKIGEIRAFDSNSTIDLAFSTENMYLKTLFQDNVEKKKQLEFVQKADPTIIDLDLAEERGETPRYHVVTQHKIINSKENRTIPSVLESSGTNNMICIYPKIKRALETGGILVADELDCNIHPLLLQDIVTTFTDPKTNPRGAQLICTLHNVVIMNRRNLRRDEIWFVEKNMDGISELYSLADIEINEKKVRSDADYCKQYILGQYGAIPEFLNDV